jgi:molybdate transport system ATP-binding protein
VGERSLIARFVKRYPSGARVEADLVLTLGRAGITVLFGPSGSGKTTVLRCIAGLETPEVGSIRCGEEVWFDAQSRVSLDPRARGVGLVFQDYALFPHLTVEENVGFGLTRITKAERRERVREALERFDVAAQARQRPRQLSGGQAQRVALARALVLRPRVLCLDEPFAALDAPLRARLREELREHVARLAIPVLLVTHEREEATSLAERVLVMANGRVVASGAPREVLRADAHVHGRAE